MNQTSVIDRIDREQDVELVRQSQDGDREAFGMLVQRYRGDLYLLARRLISSREESEDVTSETFLRAWREIKTFRGEASFKTWLWRIHINLCRSFLRHKYLQRKIFFWQQPVGQDDHGPNEDFLDTHCADTRPGIDPERCFEQGNLKQRLGEVRKILSPREQEVFAMKFDQNLKITEIGNMLALAENTVKVFLFRALKKMARALKDYKY